MAVGSEPGGLPSVSVVIATYNRARFLPETIASVLQQRFRDFELIVVDDGSTDDTQELLKSYSDPIRSFRQENRGPSAARNFGVRQARGKWISIQDSDDLATPDHLETLFRFAEKHVDCGMVFANGAYLGGPEHNRETIIPGQKSRRLAQNGVRLVDLFDKSIVRLQAALLSKKCIDALGGHDESLRICMDLDLAFRIFMRYPVAYLDQVVFLYRKHEGNIGRNQDLRLLENIRVIEKLVRDSPQARELLGARRIAQRMAYRYYRLAKGRWKEGNKGGAKEAIRKAASICPFSLKYRLYQLRWV
ncbi:MAG: glycosyltransferase [Deltaproteobacteria bacterium]|nr:glycosyltransferase [Deltaproteobacteria bacterium]